MYSICVRQHFLDPVAGSQGILIFTKEDGIDESGKLRRCCKTQAEARKEFEYRIMMLVRVHRVNYLLDNRG